MKATGLALQRGWVAGPKVIGELEVALLLCRAVFFRCWVVLLTEARCRLILPHVCSIGRSVIVHSQLTNNSLQLISFPNKIFLGDRETDHFN